MPRKKKAKLYFIDGKISLEAAKFRVFKKIDDQPWELHKVFDTPRKAQNYVRKELKTDEFIQFYIVAPDGEIIN
jgi:hypothetical protein